MNPYNSGGASGITPNSGSLAGWSQQPANSDVNLDFNNLQTVQNIYFTDGTNYSDANTTNQGSLAQLSAQINELFNPPMATYYKSLNQNFPSGTVDITFDSSMNWNNTSLITQTSPTEFTVNQSAIYQLEFNVAVNPNGATWTNFSKICQIDINRGSETSITSQYGYANSGSFYALQTSATFELLQGDIISCEALSTHTGTPLIAPISGSNFDLNTFFTWRVVSESFTP